MEEKHKKKRSIITYDLWRAQQQVFHDLDDFRFAFEGWISVVMRRLKMRPKVYFLSENHPHIFAEVALPKGLSAIRTWEDGNGSEYIYRFTLPVLFKQIGRDYADEKMGGYIRFAMKIGIEYNFEKNTIHLQYIELAIDHAVGFNPPVSIRELFGEFFEEVPEIFDGQLNEYNDSIICYSFSAFQVVMGWFFKKLLESLKEIKEEEVGE